MTDDLSQESDEAISQRDPEELRSELIRRQGEGPLLGPRTRRWVGFGSGLAAAIAALDLLSGPWGHGAWLVSVVIMLLVWFFVESLPFVELINFWMVRKQGRGEWDAFAGRVRLVMSFLALAGGLAVFVSGTLAFFWCRFLCNISGAGWERLWMCVIGWVFMAIGLSTATMFIRLQQCSGEQVLVEDKRPPVLFLRGFADDRLRNPPLILRWAPLYTFYMRILETCLKSPSDTALTPLVALGPLIAVARPGQQIAPFGAARVSFSNDEWQEGVRDLLERAALAVFLVGSTEGVRWELEMAIKVLPPSRIVFFLPFPTRKKREERYSELLSATVGILPADLPESIGDAFFICFDDAWRPSLVGASAESTSHANLTSAVQELAFHLDINIYPVGLASAPIGRLSRNRIRHGLAALVLAVLALIGGAGALFRWELSQAAEREQAHERLLMNIRRMDALDAAIELAERIESMEGFSCREKQFSWKAIEIEFPELLVRKEGVSVQERTRHWREICVALEKAEMPRRLRGLRIEEVEMQLDGEPLGIVGLVSNRGTHPVNDFRIGVDWLDISGGWIGSDWTQPVGLGLLAVGSHRSFEIASTIDGRPYSFEVFLVSRGLTDLDWENSHP